MLILDLFLLFVGCFMEAIAAQMILIPILLPVVLKLGISPIHFGLIMVLNLMIGTLTPPIGVVVYVTARVADISFKRITKTTFPFLIPLLVVLLLILSSSRFFEPAPQFIVVSREWRSLPRCSTA